MANEPVDRRGVRPICLYRDDRRAVMLDQVARNRRTWPCSCYPNYSLGQTGDMMNEIYPKWVEAHGVMIVTPVNWYAFLADQADDGLTGLCRWRKPKSFTHAWQGCSESQTRGAEGLGLPSPPERPPVLPGRARRCRGCGECPPLAFRLDALNAHGERRCRSRAGSLHWLVEALRDQPR